MLSRAEAFKREQSQDRPGLLGVCGVSGSGRLAKGRDLRVFTRITLFILGLGLSLIVPTGAAQAAGLVVQQRDDTFDIQSSNTCNGEFVELEGTSQLVVIANPDGTFTFQFRVQAKGTTTVTGTEYVLNLFRKSDFDSSGGFEIKGDAREVLVSQGSAPNQQVIFHFDFTVSPPVFSLETVCVG
jgi:hypothetical protein